MPSNYVIFSDSTCDLTREERIKFGIWPEVCELLVTYDDEPIDISNAGEFYRHLKDGDYKPGLLKTAAPRFDNITRILDDIIKNTSEGTKIVYAGISPKMSSGSVNIVNMAMDYYREEYPERDFIIVDTQCISNGLGTYLQYLAKYDGDDIEEYGYKLGKHIVHLFTESNLNYSARSGRYNCIERLRMRIATGLKISPWMFFPSDGKLSCEERFYRGNRILHAWADYYVENVADDNRFIRIGYGGEEAGERAKKFINILVKKGVSRDQIQLAYVSPVVGAHTGETVLSFFFMQKKER